MSWLTVDLGNSRLKACRWEPQGLTPTLEAHWVGTVGDLTAFSRWLAQGPVAVAAFASVGGQESADRVSRALSDHSTICLRDPRGLLEIHCREPHRVGVDRIYAAEGALARLGRSCIVVDAGTAVTVDVLRVCGAERAFLGGAIAPGPELSAAALAQGTAQLPRIEPRPGVRALGTITEDALQAGVVLGFRGAVAALVEALAQEADLGDAPLLLTGGARDFLLRPEPFTQRPLVVVPDLVHEGLLAALRENLGAKERG